MPIDYEAQGKIRIMRFNKPHKYNTLTPADLLEVRRLEGEFTADPDAWVLILTGAGDKAFCAGDDLGEEGVGGATSGTIKFDPEPRRWFSHCYKPLISAVNGVATGGGMEFVMLTDIRIAAEHAKFGLPEVRWGIIPMFGGSCTLPHQIPRCRAMELLLIGDLISAQEAVQYGLINRVVPRENLMPEALKMAERICENGPVALRLAKEVALKSWGMPREMGYLLEHELGMKAFATEDAKEGPTAFFEKRKPNFHNR
ncbi:MAG: enoyl-CoA hydratase/isomerase family protein [Chloroflexi bacterium]|nr:enoyl-CoA hydratase/isomerase family protein [Chloroflexota bacterium]